MHLPIELDRSRPEPLQNQLYEQLRGLIINRRLKPNTRLIATRFLAEQLGISRTTVLLAYERLIAEGYLETRPAVGTFVCSVLPDQAPAPLVNDNRVDDLPQTELRPPLFQGTTPERVTAQPQQSLIDFWGGPDFRIFPLKTWQRITQHILESYGRGISRPPPSAGIDSLRGAIADWLAAHRGIVVDREQIVIVAGAQQAYNIAARLFLRRGDRVVIESPGHTGATFLFESLGAVQYPVPVDDHGMLVDQLPPGTTALAYVTPSHQNPIGGTLPLDRRETLIEWARSAGAYLIEDDCDGDFRYRGMGPPSLKSLDPYGLVLYTGTFSKTLGAGLRLGYMVVPPDLVTATVAVKTLLDNGSPWLEQTVLAEFIASGEYDRHLRRVRKTYMERRDCLVGALRLFFGDVRLAGIDTGTYVSWRLSSSFPPAPMVQEVARSRGIGVYTVSEDHASGRNDYRYADNTLLLGYSSLEERQIRDGIAGLANALHNHRRVATG
ncbi:PLP-dependent aminotransferase family protein [Telmatospirillum sp.]|uniref:MocR-like pyridoxine biosynthesis transcription factor PdxR n=1 Tax=Telmatospirillum sp. TaxID=2079197 RepID=UPI002844E194|nr:PLP-dependent aminotransferase family protein [Telmatospirillum sp.]MDR3440204.1 PLP-dependent aminotransferase family protein [Telmatospirillum sp.]